MCVPSTALINKQFCRHSTEGSRDPAPVAGSSGQTLGRGSRVSATAILRCNPDGANRARDNRYGNGRSLLQVATGHPQSRQLQQPDAGPIRQPEPVIGRSDLPTSGIQQAPGTVWRAQRPGAKIEAIATSTLLIDFRFYELRQVSQRLLPAEVTRL